MYKEWPLGQLPEELERPELKQISRMGFRWNNPNEVVSIFVGPNTQLRLIVVVMPFFLF